MKTGVPPTLTGAFGSAWNVSDCDKGTPDQEATVAAWIVTVPGSHPLWPTYQFGMVHLRDLPGVRPANKAYPEAEYEFLIAALDPRGTPGHPLSPADRESWVVLTPVNITVQFDTGGPDEVTGSICEDAVRHVLEMGAPIEPDDNAGVRPYWKLLIRNTADHYRGAHE